MRTITAVLSVLLLSAHAVSAEVLVVNPAGTGDYATIQAAIDACLAGDIIELTNGVFLGDGNRDCDYLGKAITIRSQSGNAAACIVDCEGSQSEPHRGFKFHSGETANSVLESVTITNGHTAFGGGIWCYDTSPRVEDCTFLSNHAESGGGVGCRLGTPMFVSCLFQQNSAFFGGGMSCKYYCHTSLVSCRFVDNTCDFDGAGLHLTSNSQLAISATEFVDNIALRGGGGLYLIACPESELDDCVFEGNVALNGQGGAINCWISAFIDCDHCTFVSNDAGLQGGAIMVNENSMPEIHNCTFYGNSAPQAGGIYIEDGSDLTMSNAIIVSSPSGEAIRAPQLPTGSIECCDFHDNAGGDWIGGVQHLLGIDGNISEDPLFCDPEQGDFTVDFGSPCAPFSPPNPECDLIGAWPAGCQGTPTAPTTWGALKALFR